LKNLSGICSGAHVRRKLGSLRNDPAKVNDSSNLLLSGNRTEKASHVLLLSFEVILFHERMHEVVGNINTLQCLANNRFVESVAFDNLNFRNPGVVFESCSISSKHSHAISMRQQLSNQSPTDVSGSPGNQAQRRLAIRGFQLWNTLKNFTRH